MSDISRNILRRTLAGFSLGLTFVVAAVLVYLVFYVLAVSRAENFTLTDPAAGSQARGATMLLWMFLGAYLSGFLLCPATTVEANVPLQYPRVRLAIAMLLSAGAVYLVGWGILESANLYGLDRGFTLFSFFMGLVLGSPLYVWLSDRVPALFPVDRHGADEKEKSAG